MNYSIPQESNIIIDSDYSFDEALTGKSIPDDILNDLVLLNVEYYSIDHLLHRGQIIIHKDLEKDIKEIFNLIKEYKFPVEKVIPIVRYNWSDDESMKDNNTSAFNYRTVKGTERLSNHATGRAIDINPFLNPWIKDNITDPAGALYDTTVPGTIVFDSFIVKEFSIRGWSWGGNWNTLKDYQHFDKK